MIQGFIASVLASVLFGAIYYLSPFLLPLDGEQIMGWRVLWTLPFTTALVLWHGEWREVVALAQRVRQRPVLGIALLASSAMLAVQLWLFMWAPLQGRALPVSLGYFLLPLVMVLLGRLVYQETLSTAHKLAALLAALGVAWELVRAGGLSWETAVVALGYPVYFALRRELRTDRLAGHWVDMALIVPMAWWFIVGGDHSSVSVVLENTKLWVLLPILGVVSAAALALYMAANRLLPLGLFGLLTYVEPVLLVGVALLLGESVAPVQWPLYGMVFLAVSVLVVDGALHWRRDAAARAVAESASAVHS